MPGISLLISIILMVDSTVICIIQSRKLKHERVKKYTQDHTARKWWSQELNPGRAAEGTF